MEEVGIPMEAPVRGSMWFKKKRAFQPLSSIFGEFIEELEIDGGQNRDRIDTGFLALDQFASALFPGHLVVIGGRPVVGKTSLALFIAEHAAIRQGRPVGIYSLESATRVAVANRILASEASIPLNALASGRLTGRQQEALLLTKHKLRRAPLSIDAVREFDIERLKRNAEAARKQGALDLLVVDYVQLVRDFRRSHESREEEFSAVIRSLKHLARELEVPVIAVSQASGSEVTRTPEISDLVGSTPLEEHADLVLLVHRPVLGQEGVSNDSEGLAEITVAKNRSGPQFAFNAVFVRELAAFRNLAIG